MNSIDPAQSVSELTILLVEDLADDVFFFKQAMKRAGVKANVHVAEDGLEAVDYLSHQGKFMDAATHPRPDLIFLDLKMPNMNGFEVMEWLQQRRGEMPNKVIVLTGSEEPGDRLRAQSLGALAYMIKPPLPDKLKTFFAGLPVLKAPETTRMQS